MLNKPSSSSVAVSISSIFLRMLPSIKINTRSFFSQFVMIITIFILLVAFLPCISSSPTPTSILDENNNNNNKNKIIFNSNDYQTGSRGDSSLLSSSVHNQPSISSSFFYDQPRTHANQFLMSHLNDNQIIVPKWFTRYDDDDNNNNDDIDDYIPSNIFFNKRSSFYNAGGSQILKKRKQLTKPPMEVMNEIVNSIYLKR